LPAPGFAAGELGHGSGFPREYHILIKIYFYFIIIYFFLA